MSRAAVLVELSGVQTRFPSRPLRSFLGRTAYMALLGLTACASTPMDTGGRGASGATGTTGQGSGPGQVGGAWCNALAVLRSNCQGCHGTQPLYGAPMSLVTIDNLRSRAVTDPSKLVYEMVATRIHNDQNPMPPPSTNDRLTAAEAASIDSWIAGGAQGNDAACTPASGTGGGAGGNSGATGMMGTGGVGGTTGAGGNMQPPTGDWPADCEQRYKLLAHGVSMPNDATKFNVTGAPSKQFYQCFFFKAPWAADSVQALQFRPVLDDARVVHHWILYGMDSGANGTDGQVGGSGCSNGAFLAGWAPGGTGTDLPPDVGLQMPTGANAYLALQIHYNNVANYPDSLDASGVEFCTTKKFRANTAGVHWLGSNSILILPHQTANVVSTCDPTSTQPAHVLAESPHMHQTGVHAKLVLNRKDGTQETLHDQPFAFADQRSYPLSVIVNDGDTLTTTCTYNNTTNGVISFGPNTENEMCYNFVTAYPVGSLSGPAGANHCLGP